MKDYEIKEKLFTVGVFVCLLLFIWFMHSPEPDGVGIDGFRLHLSEEFTECEESDMAHLGFHKHNTSNVERSFFTSENTYLMFENFYNEETWSHDFIPNVDWLARGTTTHDLFKFSIEDGIGRIIQALDNDEYEHYFIICISGEKYKEKAVCAECFSKNKNILKELVENFDNIEDISDQFPIAIAPEDIKSHLGEVVTVKGTIVVSERQRFADWSPWIIHLDEYQSENHVSVYLYRELWGENLREILGGKDGTPDTGRDWQTIYATGTVEYERQDEKYGGDYFAVKPNSINDLLFDDKACLHPYWKIETN